MFVWGFVWLDIVGLSCVCLFELFVCVFILLNIGLLVWRCVCLNVGNGFFVFVFLLWGLFSCLFVSVFLLDALQLKLGKALR